MLDSANILIVSSRIEQALFVEHKGVTEKYKSQFRTLVANLKDKENPKLRERVLRGDLTPAVLATAGPQVSTYIIHMIGNFHSRLQIGINVG